MLNFDSKLSAFKALIDVLTWKKIFQIFLLFLVLGIGFAAYENTESLTNFFNTKKISEQNVIRLSRSTVTQLDKLISDSGTIMGMHIATVDFRNNTRTVVYGKFNHPDLDKIHLAYQERDIDVKIPLFNDDAMNNNRIVSLINGEFVCYTFKDSIAFKLAPDALSYVTSTCSLSIPPFYGKFSGIVTVYINKDLSPVELGQMRSFLQRISIIVYELNFADKVDQP